MKRFLFGAWALLTALSTSSCSEKQPSGYSGTNKIYLTVASGNAVITESDDTPLTVEVSLTSSVASTATLTFRTEDDPRELLRLEGQPVTLSAGSKQGSFRVVSNVKNLLSESTYVTVGIDPSTLPEGMELAAPLRIRVNPNPKVPELTEEQKRLLEGYKTKYGFDLTPMLGVVNCTTHLTIPGDGSTNDFATPGERTITGQTILTLSETSTADLPVLKMSDNPMGLTEYLYWVFRQNTVDDDEYWTQKGEESSEQRLMKRIQWTATSDERFDATLDGIKCTKPSATGSALDLLGEVTNSYGEKLTVVPFRYGFSAWDRQKSLLDKGDADMREIYDTGGVADPAYYLFSSGIDEDAYGNGTWIESKGELDLAKGEMTFQFIMDHAYAGDYTIVKVTCRK